MINKNKMTDNKEMPDEIKYYSDIQETDIEWLWYPYIPFGKLTLLQGDPGDGKSTFMIHIAACLTTGNPFPDGSEVSGIQNVIYQCSEDNISDTIKPRLIRAGADCSRVAYIDEEEKTLTLDDERIEKAIIETGARLIILDPLQAFIPPDSDMTNAVSMRALMRKLSKLAEKYKCAIVVIGHMTKALSGKNLYRSLGSIDITAVARSVLMIKRNEEFPNMRYMFPIKSSLAFEGRAIRFAFDKETGFRILGPCELDEAENTCKEKEKIQSKSEQTENILIGILSGGKLPSVKVLETVKEHGISERTARSVAKKIGIKSVREGGSWYWELSR